MRLSFAFFANAAEVRDRLLYVLGGNFDTLTVGEIPAQFRGALAFRIGFNGDAAPQGERHLRFVVRPPGADEMRLEASVTVSGEILDAAPWDPGILVAIKLDGMPLPVTGIYETSIVFDGHDLGGPTFRVALATKANRRARRSTKKH